MGLSKGTKVTWNTPQGTTEGTVVEKRTEDFEFDGRTYRASTDDPHYIVESADTGARATHKADALTEA
ncbi:DUF2945 domain-containing protein [Kocuria sp. CPCC 205292]|uniref:Hypervirulence associated protein TUDOR domain-containing protein n=1 Tax=Kocuria rosea subsp. polaris TaxID=136273 RepID=A0A0W8IAJ6_KOCRO|nr:DUF2945 domain-containing protein [Kocuria polaris]KUG57017.1 hypothetical protein AVL61_15640 [Kocuria polaris]